MRKKVREFLSFVPVVLGMCWAIAVPFIYTDPLLAVLSGMCGAIAGLCFTMVLVFEEFFK